MISYIKSFIFGLKEGWRLYKADYYGGKRALHITPNQSLPKYIEFDCKTMLDVRLAKIRQIARKDYWKALEKSYSVHRTYDIEISNVKVKIDCLQQNLDQLIRDSKIIYDEIQKLEDE